MLNRSMREEPETPPRRNSNRHLACFPIRPSNIQAKLCHSFRSEYPASVSQIPYHAHASKQAQQMGVDQIFIDLPEKQEALVKCTSIRLDFDANPPSQSLPFRRTSLATTSRSIFVLYVVGLGFIWKNRVRSAVGVMERVIRTFLLPPVRVTLTKRRVYVILFFARPLGVFFFS